MIILKLETESGYVQKQNQHVGKKRTNGIFQMFFFYLSRGNSKLPPQIDYSNTFKINQNSDLALKRHQDLLGCGYKKDRTKSPDFFLQNDKN